MDNLVSSTAGLLRARGARTAPATALAAVILISTLTSPVAQAQDIPPPPYFVNKGEYVVLGISADEERLRSLLPRGVKLAPGGAGVLLMYTAWDAYGLPAYTSTWLGVDVEGHDAPGGGKARMMIRGLYGPAEVAGALVKHFNYPALPGTTRVEHEGARMVASASVGGQQWVRAEIQIKPGACARAAGMAHEVTPASQGDGMQLIRVPNIGDWCGAESSKLDLSAPATDPLGRLGEVKVLWGGYWSGGFGWSAPELRR